MTEQKLNREVAKGLATGQLSRRQFLRATGGLTLASVVAACAAPAPDSGGDTGEAEEAMAEAQGITMLIRSDIRSAYAADDAVERWNNEFEAQVAIEEPAGSPDTKIQAAQAAGDLIWDAYAVVVFPWDAPRWHSRGLIQSMDEYIEASSIPGSDEVVPGIIPSIFEVHKIEGSQYGIPGNVGSVALGWFWEPMEKAGFDSQPMTWDAVREAAEKIAETSPELTPYDASCTPLCDLYAMIWGATETPLTDDGLIDISGEASLASLTWIREMVEDGLMASATGENFGNWLKGGTALLTSFDVHGTMAQQTFGQEMATTGINFFREDPEVAGTKAGTPFWINSTALLNKAANPQGAVDFTLWWFGPENKATGKQITEVAAKPCYQYTYDEFVKDDPVQQWQLEGIELVRNSVWFPSNLFFGLQNSNIGPEMQRLRDATQSVTAEEVVEVAMEGIQIDLDELKESGNYDRMMMA